MTEWYLFDEFKKKIKNEKLIVKHLKLWWWITTSILTLIALFFAIDPFHWKVAYTFYLLSLFIVFFVIVFGIFSVLKNKYGGKYEFNKTKRGFLIDILKKEGFYKAKKIEYLIQMINDILDSLKITKELFRPLISFFLVIVFPLLMWRFNKSDVSKNLIKSFPLILTILFQLLGYFYLLKPIVESILDRNYFALKEFQFMLKDIYLTDFCGEDDTNNDH